MRERLWRVFLGILLSLVAFTTSGYSVDPWTHTQMSVYGDASRWDCGHFYDGACRGYWWKPGIAQTSHYWHCDWSDQRSPWSGLHRGQAVGVAMRWPVPLGSVVEIKAPLKSGGTGVVLARVVDRGPYGVPWDIDAQWDLPKVFGWTAAEWGLRPVAYRLRPDIPAYCPGHGHTPLSRRPPLVALTPEG
jgi:hypothetical protein